MNKPNLLLLHGAIGSKSQFRKWEEQIKDDFAVHLIDFEGHGGEPMRGRPFRLPNFTENVIDYLMTKSVSTHA